MERKNVNSFEMELKYINLKPEIVLTIEFNSMEILF